MAESMVSQMKLDEARGEEERERSAVERGELGESRARELASSEGMMEGRGTHYL